MRRTRAVEPLENIDINISPLIDMMFLLLIFFIVTAVFVEHQGLEVSKPEASQSRALDPKSILFSLDASGRIFYKDRAIDLNDVRGVVARMTSDEPRPVILVVDGQVPTADMIAVMDECKKAGAEQVHIATEEAPS